MPRKQKKFHYIYKTTCNVTKRFYYGMHSTDNLEDGYLGSGQRLWHSINKHGKENHSVEILEHYEDRESLRNRERELVNENILKDPMCMNLKPGGEGGFKDKKHQQKTTRAAAKALKEKWKKDLDFREMKSKEMSERSILLHKEGKIKPYDWTGRQHSEKTKKKIGLTNSKNQSGSKNSQFGTCWIHNDSENKKIKKEDIDFYLNNGWNKGRKITI